MDPLSHFTRHLILAARNIDIKVPEIKPEVEMYKSIFDKGHMEAQMMMSAPLSNILPSPVIKPAMRPRLQVQKFSSGVPKLDSLLEDPSVSSIHYEPFQNLRSKGTDSPSSRI